MLSSTRSPIAYANIFLSSSKAYGTVTNLEGDFSISAAHNNTLNISHIGFISRSIAVATLLPAGEHVVVLEELTTELSEVIIVPRDSLKMLLAAAFSRINDNYPQTGKLVTGFYREANILTTDNSFLYFAESIIQFYKPSYENRQYGPVRITEGGKSELANRHKLSKVDFYGGLYVPQSNDFVQQRFEFIHPDHYDEYDYLISPTIIGKASSGYKIQFNPRAGAKYKGEFYLEKESLAYAGAQYQYSELGLRRHNQLNPGPFSYTAKNYTVQYLKIEDKWNLFLVFLESIGSLDSEIRVTTEYVSTQFEPVNTNPISEAESVPISGVYVYQNKAFSDEFWQKRRDILRTNALDSSVNLLLKSDEMKLHGPAQANNDATRGSRMKLHKHAAQFSMSVFMGVAPVDVAMGLVTVDYGSVFSIHKNTGPRTRLPILGYEFRYTTLKRLSYTFTYSTNLSKEFSGNYVALGTEWSKTIAGWKRALSIQPGLAWFYSDLYQDLGTTNAASSFQFGNSSIPQGPIRVYTGEQRTGISPSLAIGFRFRPVLGIYVKCSLPVALARRDLVAVTPDPVPLIGKGRIRTDSDELSVAINGVPMSSSGTAYRNFVPVLAFGIRYGF